MKLQTTLFACAATFCMAGAASAASITLTDTLVTEGQDMLFEFDGLAASNGTGATVTLETLAGSGTLGLDLSGDFPLEDEFFTVSYDGVDQASFSCDGPSSNGSTPISGAVDNGFNFNNCAFSLTFTILGAAFDTLIMDGSFDLGVAFGDDVTPFGDEDILSATLSYENISAVPLPAGGLLLLSGLGGIAAFKRRKTRAA